MLISLNWIKEFINYNEKISAKDLGLLISLRVAEVENIQIIGDSLEQVITVKIEKIQPHPNADKLKLATINTGTEFKTIVCGANNCRQGIIVPFANSRSILTIIDNNGNNSKLTIKKVKIRGIESDGMLCSKSELGLADKSDGLLELKNTPLGQKLSSLKQFFNYKDILFEIDNKSLTHRPDLWGHYGFAREFQTIFDNSKLKENFPQKNIFIGKSEISISNKAPKICRRYSSLKIKNIQIDPSPQWLKSRLNILGIKSVNNIVDVTNYVLLELGQPMHSFDAQKIDDLINIRYATENENFIALNHKEYKLTNKDLVIDSAGKVIALAGIIGGALSSINNSTTEIILEAANFDAATIRQSSIHHNLRSNSSTRFEKSLDPCQTHLAIERAAELILKICPQAKIIGQIADSFNTPYPKNDIFTSYDFIRQKLGINDLTNEFIKKKLIALGFKISDDLNIKIPSWRRTKDINIPEDIVEEVGRIYGYDNIKAEKLSFELKLPTMNNENYHQRLLKSSLTQGFGFSEIILYPWSGQKQLDFYGLSSKNLMTLKNPINQNATYMRSHSEPHFIDNIVKNLKHFNQFKLFEIGRIYDTHNMNGQLPSEKTQLIGAIIPTLDKKSLQEENFYEAKAITLDLLSIIGINNYQINPLKTSDSWVHPNIAAGIYHNKEELARIYKLHPNIAQKLSIKNNVYLFSIKLSKLKNIKRKFSYKIISKYPTVLFDITIVVNKYKLADEISQIIRKVVKKYLINLEIFSIYHSENIGINKKALSFRITFGAQDHTLDSEKITQIQDNIMEKITSSGYLIK